MHLRENPLSLDLRERVVAAVSGGIPPASRKALRCFGRPSRQPTSKPKNRMKPPGAAMAPSTSSPLYQPRESLARRASAPIIAP